MAAYQAGQQDAHGFTWPLSRTRVTDDLGVADLMKLQQNMTSSILQELKGSNSTPDESEQSTTTNKYGGDSAVYRRWERYLLSAASGIQLTELDTWVKHPNAKDFTEADWNMLYSRSDREFLYRVLMSTLQPTTADTVQRTDSNGLMIYRYFYELWGSASLANSITALKELMSLKVPRHDNPSSAFKRLEMIPEWALKDKISKNLSM
ncbi:CCHC-type domain-containing protein [Pseudoscourfieldia marina]